MNTELLPCPFCGGPAAVTYEVEEGGYFACCAACKASSIMVFACGEDPIPRVTEAWNRRSDVALRIKVEEHQCCTEELLEARESRQEGWKEAAIAWEVCSSIHEKYAKGKDALYSTRHSDFEKHAEDARRKFCKGKE